MALRAIGNVNGDTPMRQRQQGIIGRNHTPLNTIKMNNIRLTLKRGLWSAACILQAFCLEISLAQSAQQPNIEHPSDKAVTVAGEPQTGAPQTGAPQPSNDCLLAEIAKAAPGTTVEQLRAACLAQPSETTLSAKPHASEAPLGRAAALTRRPASELSLFERRQASELRAMREPFALLPHRPNFIMPFAYHQRPKGSGAASGAEQGTETVFQTSFKFPLSRPLFGGAVWPFFAYTGRAWWQVFDSNRSSPFREYNHEPELLFGLPGSSMDLFGWKHRLSVLGINHQSNGRTEPGSRSWNRVTAELFFDRGQQNWASFKFWHRLSEKPKAFAGATDGDDNPDITRYLGHLELKFGHVYSSGSQVSATVRHNISRDGRGAAQLDWSIPSGYAPSVRWYVHAFSGYGDSLIDYNVKINRFGLGIMLNDWF
jgi:phospholipase A1/A2